MEHSYEDTRGPSAWFKMKTQPKHLPAHKQRELKALVKTVCAHHDVEMIILFGSHARGDWVEDKYQEDHITYEYRSDYDILIVTADKESEQQVTYDNALKEALQPDQNGTRINYIVHTIQHVNQMLSERRFFFMDVLKEGFMLYDSARYKLARPPEELEPDVMLRHAEEYFGEWVESGDGFVRTARFCISDGTLKIAAFQFHQAAERYITCLLLVHTGYRPKEHDMEKLFSQAAGFDPGFANIFPNDTKEEKHLFELLRRAYVDARYSKKYQISEEELGAIGERIEALKLLVTEVCTIKIEGLMKVVEAKGKA